MLVLGACNWSHWFVKCTSFTWQSRGNIFFRLNDFSNLSSSHGRCFLGSNICSLEAFTNFRVANSGSCECFFANLLAILSSKRVERIISYYCILLADEICFTNLCFCECWAGFLPDLWTGWNLYWKPGKPSLMSLTPSCSGIQCDHRYCPRWTWRLHEDAHLVL